MPAKRAVMLSVKGRVLTYALRVDVPAGAEKRRPGYRSSYHDPRDPDAEAIQAGTVLERLDSMSVAPEPGEAQIDLVRRVRDYIEAQWADWQEKVNKTPMTKDIRGVYWDGAAWNNWERV